MLNLLEEAGRRSALKQSKKTSLPKKQHETHPALMSARNVSQRRLQRQIQRHGLSSSTTTTPVILLLLFFFSCCSLAVLTEGTEVKWTPNENDNDQKQGRAGPLPLSQKQRQQLLQLDQTIQKSTNPQETLVQAAQANQMDPQDLLSLLERNRSDLQQGGAGASGGNGMLLAQRGTRALVNAVMSFSVVLVHAARRNPRAFGMAAAALWLLLYALAWSKPRTGLVLSTQRHKFPMLLLSKGPSTVWNPPTAFVQKTFLEAETGIIARRVRQQEQHQSRKKKSKRQGDDDEGEEEEEPWKALIPLLKDNSAEDDDDDTTTTSTSWYTKQMLRKHHVVSLQQAASAQATLSASDFMMKRKSGTTKKKVADEKENDKEKDDDDDDEEDDDMILEIMELFLDHASDILSSRLLTEFLESNSDVRLIVPKQQQENDDSDDNTINYNAAVLVVRNMGDWNRYGLLPLRALRQQETERRVSLTLETIQGLGHWDGQIHISVAKSNKHTLKIGVFLVVPNGSHKIARPAVAVRIVQALCDSVAASVTTRTQQSLSRRSQSLRFAGRAHERALERRHSRFAKQKEMEEMATDRRRRWQRQNPNSGHYRPSGDRMRSPNNAIYK